MKQEKINRINAALNEIKGTTPNLTESLRSTAVGVYTIDQKVKVEGFGASIGTQQVASASFGGSKNVATNRNYQAPALKSTIRGPHRA